MAAFMDSLIYIANCFHYRGVRTQILRDEDITFPPTTENFDPSCNKFVKKYEDLLEALNSNENAEPNLKVYLSVVR